MSDVSTEVSAEGDTHLPGRVQLCPAGEDLTGDVSPPSRGPFVQFHQRATFCSADARVTPCRSSMVGIAAAAVVRYGELRERPAVAAGLADGSPGGGDGSGEGRRSSVATSLANGSARRWRRVWRTAAPKANGPGFGACGRGKCSCAPLRAGRFAFRTLRGRGYDRYTTVRSVTSSSTIEPTTNPWPPEPASGCVRLRCRRWPDPEATQRRDQRATDYRNGKSPVRPARSTREPTPPRPARAWALGLVRTRCAKTTIRWAAL